MSWRSLRWLYQYCRYLLCFRCTAPCRAFLLTTVILSFHLDNYSIFLIFTLLVLLLLLALVLNHALPASITLITTGSFSLIEGKNTALTCHLTNTSWFPARHLTMRFVNLPATVHQLDSDTIPILKRNQSTSCKVQLHFEQRGIYELTGLCCCSTFPFNLFRSVKGSNETTKAVVYPQSKEVRGLPQVNQSDNLLPSTHHCPHSGTAEEYLCSRVSYVIESPRHIDSRAWARLNTPALRQYYHRSENSSIIHLQTAARRPCPAQQEYFFEAAVRVAASCAHILQKQDSHVNYLFTSHDFFDIEAAPGGNAFDKVVQLLAGVHLQDVSNHADHPAAWHDALGRTRSSTYFILFDPTTCPTRLIQHSLNCRCPTCIIVITAAGSPAPQLDFPSACIRYLDVSTIDQQVLVLG